MSDTLNELDTLLPLRHASEISQIIEKLFSIQNDRKATVFLDIAGHTQQMYIRIYAPNWRRDMDCSYGDHFNMEGDISDFKNKLFSYINTL